MIIEKIKKMKKNDYKHLIKIMISFFPGILLRCFKQDIWLISERIKDAKDNGYCLFKYIMDNELKKNTYYAIDKKSNDYNKIKKYDKNIIQFGSFRHHIYTWACNKNISTQVGSGLPNRICYTLQMKKIYRFKSVFLQHGITQNRVNWLESVQNKIDLFCCVSDKEKKFVIEELGYSEEIVKNTGFCRYDELINPKLKKEILFMPTWRSNLVSDNKEDYKEYEKIFLDSQYYKTIQEYINNKELIQFLNENNYLFILYLHDNMQIYKELFKVNSRNIIIAGKEKYDIQKLLKEAEYLITDYSSIAFDFAYMNKPLQYFQFDKDNFFKNHYQEGYFKYERDGFGPVIQVIEKSIKEIKNNYIKEFELSKEYREKIKEFFKYNDKKNCDRVYNEIKKL